ncbi:MAG TPA: hypothetical protein VKF36_11445 [Syntrophorhabdales bacterium]|nr:hypothetical protein [Syntrophorhabdales bacterium]
MKKAGKKTTAKKATAKKAAKKVVAKKPAKKVVPKKAAAKLDGDTALKAFAVALLREKGIDPRGNVKLSRKEADEMVVEFLERMGGEVSIIKKEGGNIAIVGKKMTAKEPVANWEMPLPKIKQLENRKQVVGRSLLKDRVEWLEAIEHDIGLVKGEEPVKEFYGKIMMARNEFKNDAEWIEWLEILDIERSED